VSALPFQGGHRPLDLPEGKRATRVYPSDAEEPFVLAGSELLGPSAAFSGEVVTVANWQR
jgi:hypothetical protein